MLTPNALRRILQITDGITAGILRLITDLAIAAIESGEERITDEAVQRWEPAFQGETAVA